LKITEETRAKLRQALAVMKHDIQAVQQTLENAPADARPYLHAAQEYFVNDYLLLHRLDSLVTVVGHARDLMKVRNV
jgi:hypothetical protein